MRRDPRAFLWDIEHYGGLAAQWGAPVSVEQYDSDEKLRLAIERALQNCGEALVQLARHRPDLAANLPDARKVIAFRNVLVHGYDELDTTQILLIIRDHLPGLLSAASDLLTQLGRIAE